MRIFSCLWALQGGVLAAASSSLPDRVLFDFEPPFDPATVAVTDAAVTRTSAFASAGHALRIATGHAREWPGITLPAPKGHWDLSPYDHLECAVKNIGARPVTVYCRVDNPGADGREHCVTGSLRLAPGQSGTLRVRLRRTSGNQLDGKLFGMRGYPVSAGGPGTLDAANVTQLLVFVSRPSADHTFAIDHLRATGRYTPPTAWVTDADPFLPMIDTFGQYRHKDWPGKVHSLAELQRRRREEARELATQPGPADWCEFGGWTAGPRLAATGFFRTEKYQGKWWLVDPHGHLFWSHGIDCVRLLDTTPIEERRHWFVDFPGDRPEFRAFLSRPYALKGHYAGRRPKCFSFAAANVRRKYGEQWERAYAETAHRRLRHWGLNTIGNWSAASVYSLRRTPYTDHVGSGGAKMIAGSEGYWGKFPDVFDPSFAAGIRRSVESKRGTSANDPWCLGYFSDNEMSWGNDTSLAIAALKSPPGQPAKQEFLRDLQRKYGDIARLNAAWGTDHASWTALAECRDAPETGRARADLTAFYQKTARTYFRIVRAAIKSVAPRQLYLGCRFAGVNDLAARAAAEYCDVVSYNLYRRGVADFTCPAGDKPLLVGEFHFGALDRGMFHPGLVPVANQAARARAYRDYVTSALRHPQFVGVHWFQWKDEPTTGRAYDEENYQIGFLNGADTPYAETIAASRQIGDRLYEIRLGRQ